MSKLVRLGIAVSMVLGVLFLASPHAAWAGQVGDSPQAIGGADVVSGPVLRADDRGTVQPPKRWLWTCSEGLYSVGGVVTISVTDLAPYYCLKAYLWSHRWPPVHVPSDLGSILADITFLQVYYRNRPVKHLPLEDGNVELCYAVPPGKQAKIYFVDAYGKGKPRWKALDTRMKNGLACVPAQDSGAYALIGK